MRNKSDVYIVWKRGDGLVGASAGVPYGSGTGAFGEYIELLRTEDWPAARSRIRAERTAIVMNEDIYPIVASAQSNRVGVYI